MPAPLEKLARLSDGMYNVGAGDDDDLEPYEGEIRKMRDAKKQRKRKRIVNDSSDESSVRHRTCTARSGASGASWEHTAQHRGASGQDLPHNNSSAQIVCSSGSSTTPSMLPFTGRNRATLGVRERPQRGTTSSAST